MSWRFVGVLAGCSVSSLARRRVPASVFRLGTAPLLVLGAASAAWAATTDIRTVRTHLFRVGTSPLTPAQVVPPSGSVATGVGTFSLEGLGLHYEISHNVVGEVSAHIHQGAQGVNGPIRHTLPLGNPKSGTWMMTVPDLAALSADALYVDIHSAMFPGGAIRGQIRMQDLSCQNPPVEGQPVCLRVVVQNLGPDPYVGTEPPFGVRHVVPGPAAAGRLRVTVDIDEPTKPGGFGVPRTAATITDDFAVTIAPGDSATLDFGQVAYTPPSGGLFEANTTSEAQSPNEDPNPSNDTIVTQFNVVPTTPAVRFGLLALLAAALGAVAWRSVARRRAAAR